MMSDLGGDLGRVETEGDDDFDLNLIQKIH